VNRPRLISLLLLTLGHLLWPGSAVIGAAQSWVRLGPEGGQVISLAASSAGEVLLGTADGHVFASADSGQHWQLSGHVSARWDAVVQTMIPDAATRGRVFAAVWFQDPVAGGGVFLSEDNGKTWQPAGLRGEAVRALSQSSQDSSVLVAGTKSGVFRTKDAGATWKRISPESDGELRNLDSIAIDPRDANVIYAGTFHLAWKTIDGGKHWAEIADGMIDDSDIMSVAIDRTNPQRILASACSGIYRSESGGAHWTKLAGIPYASRRTQQIVQDPGNPAKWFAATTEGLWQSLDGGETWERILGRDIVVNSVAFGGPGRSLVIGTDDGIRVESKGPARFSQANSGFGHQVLSGLAAQDADAKHLLAAVDGDEPRIFESMDGGQSWKEFPIPKRPAVYLFALQDRWIASLRGGGAAVFDEATGKWKELRFLRRAPLPKSGTTRSSAKSEIPVYPDVNGIAAVGGRWFAATEDGLWSGGAKEGIFRSAFSGPAGKMVGIAAQEQRIFAATGDALFKSDDGGGSWTGLQRPADGGALLWVRPGASAPGRLLIGTRNGVFLGELDGTHNPAWRLLQSGLPAMASRDGRAFEGLWVIASEPGAVYVTRDDGANWVRLDEAGIGAVRAIAAGAPDGLYVGTNADGVVKFELVQHPVRSRNETGSDSNLAKQDE
jgi:photosystem II stability/assembly factor-like uncharacterized protein